MNPNDQPREFDQPKDEIPDEFSEPKQPETPENGTNSDFNSNPEPVAPSFDTPTATPPAEPLGQVTSPNQAFPQPAFPSPQTPPVGQPPVAAVHTGENPGQTLGIISIVLSVIGFSLIGLILGIISRNKSKAAGASTTLGTVGLIMGIVFTVIGFIVSAFLLLSIIIGVQSIASESKDGSSSSSSLYDSDSSSSDLASQAVVVAEKAEAYKVKTGDYPELKQDFEEYPESTIDSDIYLYTAFVTSTNVSYFYCAPGAAQIIYYADNTGDTLDITALGTASSTESCVEIQ